MPCSVDAEPASGSSPSGADIGAVRIVKERHETELFVLHGVIGVGIGSAVGNPKEVAIHVYLDEHSTTKPSDLPTEIEGIKVRVIPTDGPFQLY